MVEFDTPEDKLKLSLLTIEKRFVNLENEISGLKQNTQTPSESKVSAQIDLNDKVSNINARISKLEQELHRVKSRIPISAAYEDQIKELLEKVILLETRVSVLEKHITEPHRIQPVILE